MTTSKTIALVLAAAVAAGMAQAATSSETKTVPTGAAVKHAAPAHTAASTEPASKSSTKAADAGTTGASTHRPAKSATRTTASRPAQSPTKPAASGAVKSTTVSPPPKAPPAREDSTLTLRGGQEGTVFRSLTVEGEDRIHFEVERPTLKLEMDPSQAPGLEWGSARDVLDRTVPDEMAPLLATSAHASSPYTARPWLHAFASGAVATFHPDVEGVEHWKLTVANWRGEPVTSFSGKGDPPKEIAWDGRGANGAPVMPGATYSYVFEAVDRAGNHRHFVGEGFRVAAFRLESAAATVLVFTGGEMNAPASGAGGTGGTGGAGATPGRASPLLLEAASWLNQSASLAAPITVTTTARTNDEATALGRQILSQLAGLVLGDAGRIRVETRVESDAPPGGAASIMTGRMAPTAVKART
jgi:hypothetical protein